MHAATRNGKKLILKKNMVILVIFCPVLLCSTKLFMDGYRAHNCNGVLRPASLISQLPKINESFQPGIQQCAAEFFQDYTQALNITTLEYYNNGIVPSKCDTSFLKSFQFSLRSKVTCLLCEHVSVCTTNESL